MLEGSSIALVIAGAILAPTAVALLKLLLSHRKHRGVQVSFESGEHLHLQVDSRATEEEIRNLIRQDARINQKAKEAAGSH